MANTPVQNRIYRVAHLLVTNKCSRGNCTYCYLDSGLRGGGGGQTELSLETWLSLMGQVNQLHIKSLHIEGGETFEREGLSQIVQRATKPKNITIFTNGTVPYCSEFDALKAIKSLFFSIDGSTQDIHGLQRGTNLGEVLENLQGYRLAGFPVCIRTTLTRHNVNDMQSMVELAVQQGASVIRFGEFMPVGRGKCIGGELALREEEVEQVITNFREAFALFHDKIIIRVSLRSDVRELTSDLGVPAQFIPCFAGRAAFAIHHTGDVSTCSESYSLRFVGNVAETDLFTLLARPNGGSGKGCGHGHTIISSDYVINFE